MKPDLDSSRRKDSIFTNMKRWIRKIFLLFMILIITAIGSYLLWKYSYTYNSGYRTGFLQKFSLKGNFIKTYEGELILGGQSANTNENTMHVSERFYFSVTNKALAHRLDTIQGQMVILHYKQKNGAIFWRGQSKYLVDSVRQIRHLQVSGQVLRRDNEKMKRMGDKH